METQTLYSTSVSKPCDTLTPIGLFMKLEQMGTRPFFLLESADDPEDLGQYSYIGLDPIPLESFLPFRTLKELNQNLSKLQYGNPKVLPPLGAGIVGYVAYHGVQELQPIQLKNQGNIPPYHFLMAKRLLVLDHQKHQLTLLDHQQVPHTPSEMTHLEVWLTELMSTPTSEDPAPASQEPIVVKSNYTRSEFTQAVERAQEYIRAGDAFQIVLSQQFYAEGTFDGFHLYRNLRRVNPSAYLSYIRFGDFEALCSSPEMLVRQSPGLLETVPIAGTRPVLNDGKDPQRAEELLNDPKERAEHLMLVDLARNDLGRVCSPGTVEVTEYAKVVQHSRVMHLNSRVQGKLHRNTGVLEGFMAAFPAGTVSGAPKIRAMEIIDEIEQTPRNLYAGSLLVINPSGYLNSCIAIRTILLTLDRLSIQAGAGIVHDSNPDMEYEETLNKARALFQSLEAYGKGAVTYDLGD